MFKIRAVKEDDLGSLYQLSQLENFLNLPQDKLLLSKKISLSQKSFLRLDKFNPDNSFLFVIEDTDSKKIIGCSNLHAQHGTSEKPHYYLKVEDEVKRSRNHNFFFTHKTLKLGLEINGHTEIGGLVLHPNYRGHKEKLGKQISFTRFLFISLYPELFTEFIHTELLPPFDEQGNSPLWEGLGKKFFNMEYLEADIISRKDKNFIFDLFPSENIYIKLLTKSAQDAIGEVGQTTQPVKKMLESIGFSYTNEVDPFDGGPHYRCKKVDILPIKNAKNALLQFKAITTDNQKFLIAPIQGEFAAYMVEGEVEGDSLFLSTKKYQYLQDLYQKSIRIIPI